MKTLKLTSQRQNILQTTADVKAMRVFMLLALLLLCCSVMFGQNAGEQNGSGLIDIATITDKAASGKVEAADANRQYELIQWFMGSKQLAPAVQSSAKSPKAETPKRILINCGMTPNRILSRTLLKKAMQFESNIA